MVCRSFSVQAVGLNRKGIGMLGMRKIRYALVGAVAGVLVAAVPAVAAPTTAAGVASAGSSNVQRGGHSFVIPDIGQCSLAGNPHGSSSGATNATIVSFGSATATCAADTGAHTSKSQATGTNFVLSALASYGGPTIGVTNYQVNCSATTGGTNAAWQFGGLSGITVPKTIPTNYVVPIKSANGTLLANAIFNEVILPNPNDGSITLNMIHFVLFPQGTPTGATPMSGDIYVGSTACSPTS
jgi:hypothetical protein